MFTFIFYYSHVIMSGCNRMAKTLAFQPGIRGAKSICKGGDFILSIWGDDTSMQYFLEVDSSFGN